MASLFTKSHVRPQFIICLLLTVGTLLLYYPVGQFEFINYDDPGYVTQNKRVQSGLSQQNIEWAFTTFELANWHPLTWVSHMLDVTLYGMNSGAHHLTNVQFHILNTMLLFLVLLRMTGEMWKSAMVAALFAVHPLHIESVAWVSERKDVLSAFFFMLTLWCYARYVDRPSLARYLLVLAIFIFGLMTKPMLVTLPFLLLLLDYWPLNRLFHPEKLVYLSFAQRRRCTPIHLSGYLILEKVPLIVLSGLSSIVTFIAQQDGKAVSSLDALPIIVRFANSLVSYVTYIYKLIIPINLSVFYPYPNVLPLWKTGGAFLLLILFSLVAILNFRNRAYLLTGWFWFIGMLVPVIGIIQVGVQSMADRYTYLPAIGLFIGVTWGVSVISSNCQNRKYIFALCSIFILAILGMITWFQLPFWKNNISIFSHALSTTERNLAAHINLGSDLTARNHLQEAYHHFTQALQIKPKHPIANFNIGAYHDVNREYDQAIQYYREAIQSKPDFFVAYNNLGIILMKQNNLLEAISLFSESIKINHEYIDGYTNLGIALAKQQNYSESIRMFKKALRISENHAPTHLNFGSILAETGKLSEAIYHLSIALQIAPEDEMALENLRHALREKIRIDVKIQAIQSRLNLYPDDFQSHYDLAVIYKQMGKTEEAFYHFSEALRISPNLSPALQSIAIIHATKGQYDQALELLTRMTIADPDNPMGYYYAAGIYARKNQVESAVESLQKAVDMGFSDMTLLKNDSNMKNIRETAYYQELVAGSDNL